MSRACHSKVGGGARRGSTVVAGDGGVAGSKEKPFDAMNNIVANLLLNLTRLGWQVQYSYLHHYGLETFLICEENFRGGFLCSTIQFSIPTVFHGENLGKWFQNCEICELCMCRFLIESSPLFIST